MIKIVRATDYNDMSRKAANVIAAQVILKPNCVLGLATGSSPIGAYKQLIDRYNKGDLDFSAVSAVNLDEYKGLDKQNDQSYDYFMRKNFFDAINIRPENTHIPDGTIADSDKACADYDEVIRACGGIDLQLLGLGLNGHIGFNEPCDVFESGTNCVTLTDSTIEANKRFFAREEDVPRQAYTMGIGSIMQAKRILVVVSGAEKAAIVKAAFFGPITPAVPASVLRLHRNVTVVGDAAALSLI